KRESKGSLIGVSLWIKPTLLLSRKTFCVIHKTLVSDVQIPKVNPGSLCDEEPRCLVVRCNKDIETTLSSAETEPQEPMEISPQLTGNTSDKNTLLTEDNHDKDPLLFESGANTGSVQTLQSKDIAHVVDVHLLRPKNELRARIKKLSGDRDRKAQKKLINEVAKQLPNDLSRNAIEKGQGRFRIFSVILDMRRYNW
ncbi:10477_t:CDS:2, partial [Ambispora leptoticha]